MFEMRRNAGDAFISSPVAELGDKKQMLKKRRPQGAQQPQRWRFGNRNDQCFRVMWLWWYSGATSCKSQIEVIPGSFIDMYSIITFYIILLQALLASAYQHQ